MIDSNNCETEFSHPGVLDELKTSKQHVEVNFHRFNDKLKHEQSTYRFRGTSEHSFRRAYQISDEVMATKFYFDAPEGAEQLFIVGSGQKFHSIRWQQLNTSSPGSKLLRLGHAPRPKIGRLEQQLGRCRANQRKQVVVPVRSRPQGIASNRNRSRSK